MPGVFDLPHIDITRRLVSRDYQAPRESRGGGGAPRIREEHGALLQRQLSSAFFSADQAKPQDDRIGEVGGVYLEVELRRKSDSGDLERKNDGIKPGATQAEANETLTVALYVPDGARPVLEQILRDYTSGPLTELGQEPQRKGFVEPIEAFRQARLETFWTDNPFEMPAITDSPIWWEVWCFKGFERKVLELAGTLGARAADDDLRLTFPESVVIPILADRATIELLLFATVGISELRRASASPAFFTEANRQDQYDWAENLAARTIWPGADAPAVCLLDTGVNRAHVLIEPALAQDEMTAVRQEWGVADERDGHGTSMAGLCLHGDLTSALGDGAERRLDHRLESVKVLAPPGFAANDPKSYGAITQMAIARPEIARPRRPRVFCMAVTNENISGDRSTTWSAAIDQAAAGIMPGDESDAPKRLFVVSSGNAPAELSRANIRPPDQHPVEDPAQAWNALTVGGYTDKIDITEADLAGWQPLAQAGELSPFTRTSVNWPQSKCPYKPEIVMEAGNRAVSPNQRDVLSVDSLSLLTTGSDTDRQPLTPFAATSAAVAQAARLATRLQAAHPTYWPETIRGLIIHSAEWTDPMRQSLGASGGLRNNYALLRHFGYGVPSFERAAASAQGHLAIVAQAEIQPFSAGGGRRFKDCHFYRLPWRGVLEELGQRNVPVSLKITLSYFIEPNPGASAAIDPQRYQSFGLRFDLRRRLESMSDFVQRVNALERDDPLGRVRVSQDDGRWLFGPQSVAAGSLHCDEWSGPAADLAARDIVCVKPVIGWWRTRAKPEICNKKARYALVLTLSTPQIGIDLHTPIAVAVSTDVDVSIPDFEEPPDSL